MKLLALDTSTSFLSVAVAEGEKILSSYHRPAHMLHSARLIPTIDSVLKKARARLSEMDGFVLGIGPGSFTGLRIGVTTVKALAFVTKKPVVAIPTLDAIAHNAGGFRGTVCPVLDAKKGKVYACLYESGGDKLKRISDYLLIAPDELMIMIGRKKMSREEKVLFLGDGAEVYKDALAPGDGRMEFYEGHRWHPRARVIAMLGLEKFKKKIFSDIFDLTPFYLYSKECDIKGW